jgi:hypothetical protein
MSNIVKDFPLTVVATGLATLSTFFFGMRVGVVRHSVEEKNKEQTLQQLSGFFLF